ncbi:MAG: PhoH family protein [Myxococcota bacterium]
MTGRRRHEEASLHRRADADGASGEPRLVFDDNEAAQVVCGPRGEHLRIVSEETGANVHARGNELTVLGAALPVGLARRTLVQLYGLARRGRPVSGDDVRRAVAVMREEPGADLREIFDDTVFIGARARVVAPKGLAQKRYVEAMRRHDIVFGIGPAGTGKTYLAMAMALAALQHKKVKRLVLTRPAVEAGEKLGFLPGSMEEKVNPYLRPLYDALQDMADIDRAQQLIERGIIEVAPLAFMRGRTLNDSFVILDEAQNTTSEQMLMFLTRLGFESQAVIIGDVTQTDLPATRLSGLQEARDLLSGVPGIAFCGFTEIDVVRHPLVQQIIKAYQGRG